MLKRAKRAVFFLVQVVLNLLFLHSFAQSPISNIGFERGDLNGWECFTGMAPSPAGTTNPRAGYGPVLGEVPGRHTIISGLSYTQLDPYGGFPVICPNGSNYNVQLGNSSTGGEYESMSYTFTVPANAAVTGFSLIYHYAVVFENPTGHTDAEQPRFQAKVYDLKSQSYIDCGSFDFVSSSAIPGFQLSDEQGNSNGQNGNGIRASVYYKPWSAVSLNLSGYAGNTLRLEFSTADCTRGGHFGYAYVDVDEAYATQIMGSVICDNSGADLVLHGPVGFKEYYWYKASDLSTVIGSGDFISVPPEVGAGYALRLVPYAGFGCENTVYATISSLDAPLELTVPNVLEDCNFIDLTNPSIVAGSTPGLTYTYYRDPELQQLVPNAIKLTESGTYYVKGTTISGCSIAKGIQLIIHSPPALFISPPAPVCGTNLTADITQSAVTKGSDPGIVLSYWKNREATDPLTNPSAIPVSGTYYIKATSALGCTNIGQVTVVIEAPPVLKIDAQQGCHFVDLTTSSVTAGNAPGLTYSYWTDNSASLSLANPSKITISGTYYIKASTANGCSAVKAVEVMVYVYPVAAFSDPKPVIYPATVSLPLLVPVSAGLIYSYFTDAKASIPIKKPEAVGISGTYYIKIVNGGGCFTIKPVKVVILPPEDPVVTSVNTFSPNGDGVNDQFKLDITGNLRVRYFRIFNRWGTKVFETVDLNEGWDGNTNGNRAGVGTYYWVFDSFDDYRGKEVKRSGSITVVR